MTAVTMPSNDDRSAAERDANFHAWFGASKAVNAIGAPLVLFHGTMRSFAAFDAQRFGTADHGTVGHGIYASANPAIASNYAKVYIGGTTIHEGGNVMPLHMAIEHPINFDDAMATKIALIDELRSAGLDDAAVEQSIGRRLTERLVALGYDGVAPTRGQWPGVGESWTAFRPQQVKSAVGNRGTYDIGEADIRFARDAGAQLTPTNVLDPIPPGPRMGVHTEAFRQWFGRSQIVDATGEPLVVVHATLHDFATFELGKGEAQSHGFFFAGRELTNFYLWSYLDAVKYQEQERPGDHFFMPLYLSIQNPKRINTTGTGAWADPDDENAEIARARREGHDGLILRDDEQDTTFYVAFAPTQIKSALSNNGDYSPAQPDIRFARSHHVALQPSAFTQWFDGSVLVDAGARPLRVFHGSPAGHFAHFDRAFEGANTGPASAQHALGGFYFTDNPVVADTYARTHEVALANSAEQEFGIAPRQALPAATLYPCYLRLRNPLIVVGYPTPDDIAQARSAGRDGVIAVKGAEHEFVVFDAEQIMSTLDPIAVTHHAAEAARSDAGFAPVDTSTDGFRAWFDRSAIVDDAGGPLVVYHGTQADVSAFAEAFFGDGADQYRNMGDWGDGFYFSNDRAAASAYAIRAGESDGIGANVMPVYLSIQKPIDATKLYEIEGVQGMLADPYPGESLRIVLEGLGYDGIIVDGGREIVAFRASQIKSAIANTGAFDLSNPDLRFARTAGPALPAPAEGPVPAPAPVSRYRLFHGTRAHFTAMVPSQRAFYGAGLYLTDDEAEAWEYAENAAGTGAPRVYTADVHLRRPFIFDAPEAMQEPTSYTLARHLLSGPALERALRQLQHHFEMGSGIQEELIGRGYDGLIVRLPESPTEYVAFRTEQVVLRPEDAPRSLPTGAGFREWFAGSRAVDGDGQPLTLFHGTKAEIHAFEKGRSNFEDSSSALGYFFARDPALASTYASHDMVAGEAAPNVMPVHLALRHPKLEPASRIAEIEGDWTADQAQAYVGALQAEGHDGIVFGDAEYVVFTPTQIKSVFHANPYAPEDARISFRRAADSRLSMPGAEPDAQAVFDAWFAGSAVAEWDGSPRVAYHGTSADFAMFDSDRSDSPKTGVPHGTFFFSSSPAVASSYTVAWQGDFSATYHDGANVKPVYLSLRKPLRVSAKGEGWKDIVYKGLSFDINALAAMAKGAGRYDGVIVTRVRDQGVGRVAEPLATTYIAFHPSQIRNAITGEVMGPEQLALRFRRDADTSIDASPARDDKAAFDAWFHDSRVVDGLGEPLEVFHGTGVPFYEFDPRFIGQRDGGFFGRGFYFTTDLAEAESYAESFGEEHDIVAGNDVHVVRAHVALRNPFLWDVSDAAARADTMQKLAAFGIRRAKLDPWDNLVSGERERFDREVRRAGHDGVLVIKDSSAGTEEVVPGIAEVVAFHPNQIKSTENVGSFDPDTPDIRFRRDDGTLAPAALPALDFSVPAGVFSSLRDLRLGDTRLSYGIRRSAEGDTLKIYSLRTPVAKRRHGYARAALQAVLQQADAAGLPVTLDASPLDRRTRLDRLVVFYASLGFAPTGAAVNGLGHPVMARAPQDSHRDPQAFWRARALEQWFGSSAIVDDEGRPLPVYHGTAADVAIFDRRRLGEVTETSDAKLGFWFAAHPERANAAADDAQAMTVNAAGANVMPVLLRMEHPYEDYASVYASLSDPEATARLIRRARRAGHDGVIFVNGEGGTNYVVFESDQIKSAIGNAGTYSRSTADIRYRRDALPGAHRRIAVALPRAALQALQPISEAQAAALVAAKTGKPHGVDPAQHFDCRFASAKRNLYGHVPLSAFVANDAGERYDGTVDLARAYAYAAQPAQDVPPVIAVIGRHSGMLNIIDGGHRLSAARLRGDARIPVIVRVPADAELVYEHDSPAPPPTPASTGRRGLSAEAVRAALDADAYAHHVDIFATFADTPGYVQAAARRESNHGVKGYWDPRRNRVALVAEFLNSADEAREIARHELIGHFGIERMLGEARIQEVVAMTIAAERAGNPVIVRYAQRVDVEQPGLNPRRRALEIIAHMAEDNVHDHGIMRRVADGMRVFLHRVGFLRQDVTDARLCRLLRDSQRYVRQLEVAPAPEVPRTSAAAPQPSSPASARQPGHPAQGWAPAQTFYGTIGGEEEHAALLRSLGVELGPYDYALARFPARFGSQAKAALDTLTTDFAVRAVPVHRGAEVGFFSPRHRNAAWLTERRAVLDWHLSAADRTPQAEARLRAEREAIGAALRALQATPRPPATHAGDAVGIAPA
ncbi:MULTISPECIES: ADP-ribosyltransferase-containing protein [Cupriavidus]